MIVTRGALRRPAGEEHRALRVVQVAGSSSASRLPSNATVSSEEMSCLHGGRGNSVTLVHLRPHDIARRPRANVLIGQLA
jgi:hypothetical protein